MTQFTIYLQFAALLMKSTSKLMKMAPGALVLKLQSRKSKSEASHLPHFCLYIAIHLSTFSSYAMFFKIAKMRIYGREQKIRFYTCQDTNTGG